MSETVIIVDFGGQYNQLIARRVRENNVYSEVVPYHKALAEIIEKQPKGIIFTGGPASVYEEGAPTIDPQVFRLGIPVLGICYGAQLMAYLLGGKVVPPVAREYGRVPITTNGGLMGSIVKQGNSWMSHGDQIETIPEGFAVTATSASCPVAAMENASQRLYAVQFHPEVQHTEFGRELLHAFLYDVCGCTGDWTSAGFVEDTIAKVRAEVGEERRVLCALSGGVDSTVAAVLVHKAIGDRLTCIFVDHGLLRKDEGDQVMNTLTKEFDMNIIRVNAKDLFLGKLAGVTEPEKKRKIIGAEFIRFLMRRRQSWARWITCCRARSIRMSSRAVPAMRRSSRATIMSAVCPRMCSSSCSSRCGCSSRMRCVRSGGSWPAGAYRQPSAVPRPGPCDPLPR